QFNTPQVATQARQLAEIQCRCCGTACL
ncbi:uncharacterized protein METZ01_LOCUS246170, partial [marine metagenome]